jgi:hypothetical protein
VTSPVLVATDLDHTLIYSRAFATREQLICVEVHNDEPASFMTSAAADLLAELTRVTVVVPVTTRLPAQLSRVTLPGAASRYAIAANGGFLFVDGRPDEQWTAVVRQRIAGVAALAEVLAEVETRCRPAWTRQIRNADDLFCYAIVDRPSLPEDFVAEATAWAADRGWSVSLQGRKLYWLPQPLTKSSAVAEIRQRLGSDVVLAAGDSLLDRDLLESADRGIHPAHGELADSGWTAAHVTRTDAVGVLAGEEICRWFTDAVPTFAP